MKGELSRLYMQIYVRIQVLAEALKNESGQDLVEYALIIAVVCLGIISGMSTLASGINTAMNSLSTNLNAAVA
jgi:pilus assembly protein Flp/PilA